MIGCFCHECSPIQVSSPARLVADDTPGMLDCISAFFEIEGDGAEVVATASNGIYAIRATYALRPDLIVLDVSMPLMNGFEAVPHVNRHLSDTKVLLVSFGKRVPESHI